jgi:C4-dicarboxylate-binding protein DctP
MAHAKEEYVMRIGHVDTPDAFESTTHAYCLVLKEQVEKLSGGRIKVEIYPSGQLGDQRASCAQVRKGVVESSHVTPGVLAGAFYPKLTILDMPFIYSSYEHLRRIVDFNNPLIKEMVEDCAEKTDIRMLSLINFGFKNFSNNIKPVKTPDDIKGIKVRVQEIPPYLELYKALGANPIPLPYLELYTSLQTGVVNAMENPPSNYLNQKFYQVQKYITVTGHVMTFGTTIVNEKWFQSLPDDLKLALVEGEQTAQQTYNGLSQLIAATGLEKLKSFGMEIYVPSPKELEAFKNLALPRVKKWMVNELGEDFVNDFLALVESKKNEIKKDVESMKK